MAKHPHINQSTRRDNHDRARVPRTMRMCGDKNGGNHSRIIDGELLCVYPYSPSYAHTVSTLISPVVRLVRLPRHLHRAESSAPTLGATVHGAPGQGARGGAGPA